jgi:PleD family two-component response regulator
VRQSLKAAPWRKTRLPDISFCRFLSECVKNSGTALHGPDDTVKTIKKRMLIVDDQRMVSDALKMILKFDGYEVQINANVTARMAVINPLLR